MVGSLAVGAPVPKSLKLATPPDQQRILGAWEVYSDEAAIGKGSGVIWTFTEGKMHSNSGNTDWHVTLDPEQSPKHITIADVRGGSQYPGIYEFDGEKLKILYSTQNRPASFAPGQGSMNYLIRVKAPPGK